MQHCIMYGRIYLGVCVQSLDSIIPNLIVFFFNFFFKILRKNVCTFYLLGVTNFLCEKMKSFQKFDAQSER